MQTIYGSGGAPGVALGTAFLYGVTLRQVPANDTAGLPEFVAARERVATRLGELAQRIRATGKVEEAQIFDAQALMATDPSLEAEVQSRLAQGLSLEAALEAAIAAMCAVLESLDDQYLRERAADVAAVGTMLVQALHGIDDISLADLPAGVVVIAPDLTPAETVDLPADRVVGFVTAFGGPTGHTAILARSLGIPAVVGAGEAALALATGTSLILDGNAALLIADPDEATRSKYQERVAELVAARERQSALVTLSGATADGHPVALWANIGRPEEAARARAAGAEGIGLFRTEFLFLQRTSAPSEEEQLAAYRAALATMEGRTVVVRTIDIGGDKPVPYLSQRTEANPFLGVRGLRFCMAHPELFQTQLRALLRAAAYGDLWLMLPMVSTLDDVEWARDQLREAVNTLETANVSYRVTLPIGIMVETPSVAVAADLFAKRVDFFSIGSNDLTQYTLAADRGDGELARRYQGSDVSVWRLIERTIAAGRAANIPVGICGDLAGDLDSAVALVGLGINELSMAPAMLLPVRERLRQVTLAEARQFGQARLWLPD